MQPTAAAEPEKLRSALQKSAAASAECGSDWQSSDAPGLCGIDGLLPAVTLRAGPPSDVAGASRVVAWLALVFAVVPLCSYVRIERLQRVATAHIPPRTEGTACLHAASAAERLSRPAVLLPCWALGAESENLLGASQCSLVRKVFQSYIAPVVPQPGVGACTLQRLDD